MAHRLALDHPGRLSQLAVLDILPTYEYWARMNRAYALKIYHWAFLAQPQPLPAMRIALLADQHLRTCQPDDIQAFARAVERAHGIGRTTQGGA